jgi:uncharacterized membrane protein
MTEGPTPRDPRDEPERAPLGGPEAPVDQPPADDRPADTPPGPEDAPRWESPGTPPPPPPAPPGGTAYPPQGEPGAPQGGGWDPGPGAAPPPPPPPPPAGGPSWGEPGYQQPGYQQPGYQQPGGQYPGQPATTGMAENVASGLSYVLTWLTGLIFFLIDKRPEVRFHAMQSIAYGVLWTLIAVVRPYMPGPIGALFGLVLFALFIGWIVLLIQGFQGKHFKLPVIGDFAEQQASGPRL